MDNFFAQARHATPSGEIITTGAFMPGPLITALGGLSVRASHSRMASGSGLDGCPDLLILAVGQDDRTDPDHWVALADDAARIHCPVILSAPLPVIDHVPDRLWSLCHSVLSEPDMGDYAATISVALSMRPGLLSDISRDVDAVRLQRLADEVGRIARTLANLSAAGPLSGAAVADLRPGFFPEPATDDGALSVRMIRGMIRQRRLRDRFFDSNLFADPAWDMLLDLMAARLERIQVSVSSLCIAACVPPTTALRWIKMMTDQGLFERVADPVDGRRIFIRLSDSAAQAMTRLLSAMAPGDRLV